MLNTKNDGARKAERLMENYQILLTGKGWQLTREGNNKVLKSAETKAEMIEVASTYLRETTAILKIHDSDGKLQEKRTYPNSADTSGTDI